MMVAKVANKSQDQVVHVLPFNKNKLSILGIKEIKLERTDRNSKIEATINNLCDKLFLSVTNADKSFEAYLYDIENAILVPYNFKKPVIGMTLLENNQDNIHEPFVSIIGKALDTKCMLMKHSKSAPIELKNFPFNEDTTKIK